MRLSRSAWFVLPFVLLLALAARRDVAHAKSSETTHAHAHHGFRLAVTVDDLPGGGPEVLELSHGRIVRDIIAVLQKHHVRHATGFVVGSTAEASPERAAALDAWVEAGFEVGNHTYSHRSLNEIGLDDYLEDIERNRAVVDPLEARSGQKERFFRYPYLEEGRTESERRTLSHFLAEQRYIVARVSIDFADWGFADAYGRCLRQRNEHALSLLGQSYLANAVASLRWSLTVTHEVVGHPIAQVLLLHANLATDQMLDRLLTEYERQGAHYVPLAEALNDSFYTAPYSTSGGTVLVQASEESRRPRAPGMPRPLELLELVCEERPVSPPLL